MLRYLTRLVMSLALTVTPTLLAERASGEGIGAGFFGSARSPVKPGAVGALVLLDVSCDAALKGAQAGCIAWGTKFHGDSGVLIVNKLSRASIPFVGPLSERRLDTKHEPEGG